MTVLNTGKPFFVFKDISKLLVYRPIIVTSSPGRAISIKSPVRITSYNIRKNNWNILWNVEYDQQEQNPEILVM